MPNTDNMQLLQRSNFALGCDQLLAANMTVGNMGWVIQEPTALDNKLVNTRKKKIKFILPSVLLPNSTRQMQISSLVIAYLHLSNNTAQNNDSKMLFNHFSSTECKPITSCLSVTSYYKSFKPFISLYRYCHLMPNIR